MRVSLRYLLRKFQYSNNRTLKVSWDLSGKEKAASKLEEQIIPSPKIFYCLNIQLKEPKSSNCIISFQIAVSFFDFLQRH